MRLDLRTRLLGAFRLLVITTLLLAACDSSTGPEERPTQEVGVVVNSVDHSLTVFRVDDPSVRTTIGLGPDGSPGTIAVRGEIAVVPMGTVPAAAVVDLRAGTVLRTVALPQGSGATGAAFLNDSIALVANSNLGTVSPINVRTGQRGADLTVGRFPQAAVSIGDTVLVLNAELVNFSPAGPGTVSVIASSPLRVIKTITLRGTNTGAAAVGSGGRIFVINTGRFGSNEGSLSVLDRGSLTEVAHHTGFGSGPGSIAVDSSNRVYVGGFGIGVMVWDGAAVSFIRGPANAVVPGGIQSASGVAIDSSGRLYALKPECRSAGAAYRLGGGFDVQAEIPTGTCPINLVFTHIAAVP